MKSLHLRHEIVESMREIVFGLEDSLVSTLGTLTGIAVGAGSSYVVILSGFVLLAAESTSMAAGSYLSSKSAEAAESVFHKEDGEQVSRERSHPIRAAVVMWVFYVVGGFVPLFPYLLFDVSRAIPISIILTVLMLFLVGSWAATYTKRSRIISGLEMVGISLAAAFIGYVIGRAVAEYFGVTA